MATSSRDWKANVDSIRKVLIGDWNPIGSQVPEDEYDSYIPTLYLLMQVGENVETLARYLESVETKWMGLAARPEVNQRVATTLLDLMK